MPEYRGTNLRPKRQADSQRVVKWSQSFNGGVDYRDHSIANKPDTVQDMDGFEIIDGEITRASGTIQYGDDFNDSPWINTATSKPELVEALELFVDSDGVEHLIGHSATEHAVYDGTTDQWVDKTGLAPATASLSGFWDSTSGYTDSVPAGLDATRKIYAAVNGTSEVWCWDGQSGANFQKLTPTLGGNNIGANNVAYFANRLIFLNTFENGQRHASRVRWCVNGDWTDWDGIGAGANDIAEVEGNGKGIVVSSGACFLMFERGIVKMEPTGNAAAPFRFSVMNSGGIGLFAPKSLVGLPDGRRIFMSRDLNIYIWDPSDPIRGNPQPTADPVVQKISDEINRAGAANIWGVYNNDERKYLLGIPRSDNNYVDAIYTLDLQTGGWSRRTLNRFILAASVNSPTAATDINALSGTIEDLGGVAINALAGTLQPQRTVVSVDTTAQSVSGTEVTYARLQSFQRGRYTLGFVAQSFKTPFIQADTHFTDVAGAGWTDPTDCYDGDDSTAGYTNETAYGTIAQNQTDAILFNNNSVTLTDLGLDGSENIIGVSYRINSSSSPSGRSAGVDVGEIDLYLCSTAGSNIASIFGTSSDQTAELSVPVDDTRSNMSLNFSGTLKEYNFLLDNNFQSGTKPASSDQLGLSLVQGSPPQLWHGISRGEAAGTTAGAGPMLVADFQWAYIYESLNNANPYRSTIQSNFFDFDLPDKLKVLSQVTILYRDITAVPTAIRISVTPSDEFTALLYTEGKNDGNYKRMIYRPFITDHTFSVKIQHDEEAPFTVVGFEAHGTVLGDAFL